MKLAEALIERADLQKRLDQLEQRLQSNALVQEGQTPAEDPLALMKELDTVTAALESIVTRINHTNAAATADGETLTSLISRRDILTKKTGILRRFLHIASQTAVRSRGSEIIVRSSVNVREMQAEVDRLSKELREIDTRIQAANWSTELI